MEDAIWINCPYCGASFEAWVDGSAGDQTYWEDCGVCCRPIRFSLHIDRLDGSVQVTVKREDE